MWGIAKAPSKGIKVSTARGAASATRPRRPWGVPRLSKSDSRALRHPVFLSVPTELIDETQRIVVAAMESVPEGFTVLLKVELKAGRTWAECK